MAAARRLTAAEWKEVFRLRCKNKRGEPLSAKEQRFVERAWREDPERYKAMDDDVYEATLPFGAINRRKR